MKIASPTNLDPSAAFMRASALVDVEPQPASLATAAIKMMGESIFPKLADIASDEILSALGIVGNSEVYQKQIASKLEVIRQQLTALQISVDRVFLGVTQIKEAVADDTLQYALRDFEKSATLITTDFGFYVDAVKGLTATDSPHQARAAGDLFTLFSFDNLRNISVCMTDIRTLFLPSTAGYKGLLEFQQDKVLAAVDAFAATPNVFKGAHCIPNDPPLDFAEPIYQGCIDIANKNLVAVANAFKAFITVQLQGLILLTTAWAKIDDHADLLNSHVSGIQVVLDKMMAFEAEVSVAIDAHIRSSIESHNCRLGSPTNGWNWRLVVRTTWLDLHPCPFDQDWFVWRVWGEGTIVMQWRPWGPPADNPPFKNFNEWGVTGMGAPGMGSHIFPGPDGMTFVFNSAIPYGLRSEYVIPKELQFIRSLSLRDPLPLYTPGTNPPLTHDFHGVLQEYGPVITDRLRYTQYTLLSNVFNNLGLLSSANSTLTSKKTSFGLDERWQVLKVGDGGTIVDAFEPRTDDPEDDGRNPRCVNFGDRVALRSASGFYLSGNLFGSGNVGLRDVFGEHEAWCFLGAYSESPGEPISSGDVVKLQADVQMVGASSDKEPRLPNKLLSGESEGGGVRTFFTTVGLGEAWLVLGWKADFDRAGG